MSTIVETLPAKDTPAKRTQSAEAQRIFRMGPMDLPDIAPDLEPLQSLRQYLPQWPHLRRARLSEPATEGNFLVYQVEEPPVKTKG
jgi:PRTRC genetic system protein C